MVKYPKQSKIPTFLDPNNQREVLKLSCSQKKAKLDVLATKIPLFLKELHEIHATSNNYPKITSRGTQSKAKANTRFCGRAAAFSAAGLGGGGLVCGV